MTKQEDIWNCSECGNPQGRHDMWFEGDVCGICHAELEPPIRDKKSKILNVGDLVMLMNAYGLNNKKVTHNSGDVLQYIGGKNHNIGCFIHCKTKQRTDFFADRTLKLNKNQIAI